MLLSSVSHNAMTFPMKYPRTCRTRSAGKTTSTGEWINDLNAYRSSIFSLNYSFVKDTSYSIRNRKERRKSYSGRYKEPITHPLLDQFLPR